MHGVEADVISDGGSMPVMRMFEEVCESCDVGVLSLFFRDSTRSVSVSLDFAALSIPCCWCACSDLVGAAGFGCEMRQVCIDLKRAECRKHASLVVLGKRLIGAGHAAGTRTILFE